MADKSADKTKPKAKRKPRKKPAPKKPKTYDLTRFKPSGSEQSLPTLPVKGVWNHGHFLDRVGRPFSFESPEHLLSECLEYFEWVEKNPLYDAKLTSYQGETTQELAPKRRVMTIMALRLFLGISEPAWNDYKAKPAFSCVCSYVEEFIRNQKFEGAAADQFNAQIIMRDLGLREQQEVHTTGAMNNSDENAAKARDGLLAMLGEDGS